MRDSGSESAWVSIPMKSGPAALRRETTSFGVPAGATIVKDVPPGGLTLTEKKQVSKPGWERPRKKK